MNMQGLSRVIYLYFYTWCIGQYTQVEAYISDDVLNSVKSTVDVWLPRVPRLANQPNSSLSCEKPNFYICEEPEYTVPPQETKKCDYRNQEYHEQVFRWVAGRGCLLYTPDFLYVGGVNTLDLTAGCFYGNLYAPCLELPKDDGTCGCFPLDPGLEEVAKAVRDALIPAAHGRWESCFFAASDCCSHFMYEDDETENDTERKTCRTTFDGWTCWHETQAGTIAESICSEFAYSGQGPSCNHFSSKHCFLNGTWELQTDYSTCSITPRLLRRYRFYIAVLSFSIVSCLPAVFVFFFYKRLRITRVALHRNLLIAIIIRNILVIVSRSEIYIDELTNTGETVMSTHGVGCRILAVVERIAANAVFVCMLVEGIYLHRLIVAVFRRKLNIKWLYAAGAVIAVAPTTAWAVVMGIHDDHSCWLVYTTPNIQWVLDAPRVAILLINTVLFCDVFRVLLTKIRNSENANQLNTTKATLFLMPIFGVQFLLTAFRPNTDSCTGEQIYYYVSYTVEGLQGFIVAMLYCYVNKEVHALIKGTYKKTERAVVSRVRGDSEYPRMSLNPNSDRRMTYSTNLNTSNQDEAKDQYATVTPKLHVAEIISIEATEKLADILDPVYETIENGGIGNEGYDSLERSDLDNDPDSIPNRDSREEYYAGFTNASSVSIDCQDWIRCISSPSSSVYNNSLNDYETRYLERKFPYHHTRRLQEIQEAENRQRLTSTNSNFTEQRNKAVQVDNNTNADGPENAGLYDEDDPTSEFDEDFENMLDEIMQYMENEVNPELALDPKHLCPNRKDDDNIVFVENP